MPVLQARSYGDLYVEAEIETPVNLSTNQKKLIAEFNDSLVENNNPKPRGTRTFLKIISMKKKKNKILKIGIVGIGGKWVKL